MIDMFGHLPKEEIERISKNMTPPQPRSDVAWFDRAAGTMRTWDKSIQKWIPEPQQKDTP